VLRTADSVAPLQAPAVQASLVAFIVVYFLVFGSGTFYVLRLMAKRPRERVDIDRMGPARAAGVLRPAPVKGE
jgi:cytochrome d ubiquinol oxidase subunit I